MNNNWTSKIGDDDYNRPKQTYTDKLTPKDTMEKLEGYVKVENIYQVPLKTHLRYFKKLKDGSKKFCMGGFLKKNTGLPKYLVLDNGKISWTVQVENADFFRKMSTKEIIDNYESKFEQLENTKDELRSIIKTLKSKIKLYENELMKTKEENLKYKKYIEKYKLF